MKKFCVVLALLFGGAGVYAQDADPQGPQGPAGEDGETEVVYRTPEHPASTYAGVSAGGITPPVVNVYVGDTGLLSQGQDGLGMRAHLSLNRSGGTDATLFGVGADVLYRPHVVGGFSPYAGGGVYYQFGATEGSFDEPRNGFAGVITTGLEYALIEELRPFGEIGVSRQFDSLTDPRATDVELAFGVNVHF